MAAVDRFSLLYREISRSCSFYMEALALVGAWYTVRKCVSLAFDAYSMLRWHVVPKLGCEVDLVKQYGQWAVVTGSTDGVGKAYAEELAKRGVNVVLVSRSKEKLEAVSRSISETYKVETDFIVADFSKGREPYPAIKEALKDREIGILVNNVGMFTDYPDYFANLSEDVLWDMIHINIASANMMTHIVLPGMLKKKKGAIVNISSIVCCQPTPLITIYGASKIYFKPLTRQYLVARGSSHHYDKAVAKSGHCFTEHQGMEGFYTTVPYVGRSERSFSPVIIHPEKIQSAVDRMGQMYLDYFSRAIHHEYASKGIFVQSLIPSTVATKMVAFSSFLSKRSFLLPSAEEYASHAVSTLGVSTRTAGYWKHEILLALAERLPEWMWARLALYVTRILRKQAVAPRGK